MTKLYDILIRSNANKHKLNIRIGFAWGSSWQPALVNASHGLLYLKAGGFAGQFLSYDDPGKGYISDTDHIVDAFKPLYYAIQGTKSLSFVMPANREIEDFYRQHTTLDKKIGGLSIDLYSDQVADSRPFAYPAPPAQSMGLFDVTVSGMVSNMGVTAVGMFYSSATLIYFGSGHPRGSGTIEDDL